MYVVSFGSCGDCVEDEVLDISSCSFSFDSSFSYKSFCADSASVSVCVCVCVCVCIQECYVSALSAVCVLSNRISR